MKLTLVLKISLILVLGILSDANIGGEKSQDDEAELIFSERVSDGADDKSKEEDSNTNKSDVKPVKSDDESAKSEDKPAKSDDESAKSEDKPAKTDDESSKLNEKPSKTDDKSATKEDDKSDSKADKSGDIKNEPLDSTKIEEQQGNICKTFYFWCKIPFQSYLPFLAVLNFYCDSFCLSRKNFSPIIIIVYFNQQIVTK